MNSEKIISFFQEHWYFVTLAAGVLLLIGVMMNWNWVCDPTGKPHAERYTRGWRRVVFFLLSIVLIVVSIWGFVLVLK